jgi:hypothetical protein
MSIDVEMAAARRRLREQVKRVREAREDGGDVVLAMRTLRHLWRGYGVLIEVRRARASFPMRATVFHFTDRRG